MNESLSLFTHTWAHKEQPWSVILIKKFTANSVNVWVCLTPSYITDRSHWWNVGVSSMFESKDRAAHPETKPTMSTGKETDIGSRKIFGNSLVNVLKNCSIGNN